MEKKIIINIISFFVDAGIEGFFAFASVAGFSAFAGDFFIVLLCCAKINTSS